MTSTAYSSGMVLAARKTNTGLSIASYSSRILDSKNEDSTGSLLIKYLKSSVIEIETVCVLICSAELLGAIRDKNDT